VEAWCLKPIQQPKPAPTHPTLMRCLSVPTNPSKTLQFGHWIASVDSSGQPQQYTRKWGTIMGAPYAADIVQWSRGE